MLGNKADIVKQDDQKAGWQHQHPNGFGGGQHNQQRIRNSRDKQIPLPPAKPHGGIHLMHANQADQRKHQVKQGGIKKDQHDRQQAQPDNGRQNACFHTGLVSFQQQFGTIYSYAKARRNLPE